MRLQTVSEKKSRKRAHPGLLQLFISTVVRADDWTADFTFIPSHVPCNYTWIPTGDNLGEKL